MKKLFTIDDFAIAFVSAMGYGFGYTIPMHLGWPELACLVACFALGIALEEIIGKIVFCRHRCVLILHPAIDIVPLPRRLI